MEASRTKRRAACTRAGKAKRRINDRARRVRSKPLACGMDSPEILQNQMTNARVSRVSETKDRNQRNQANITTFKAFKKNRRASQCPSLQRDHDRQAFFALIDEPIAFICGSCGELANARSVHLRRYTPDDELLALLQVSRAGQRQDGLVQEAKVRDPKSGDITVPLCDSCMRALKHGRLPKFCQASGFVLADVPPELQILNTMESRMVGLGICFTTCYKLPGDGQECSKGNGINYWNDACRIAATLPHPVEKCGVVMIRCQGDRVANRICQVRPNLIREALMWLRANNPLYANTPISEETLHLLESQRDAIELPSIEIDQVGSEDEAGTNDQSTIQDINQNLPSADYTIGNSSPQQLENEGDVLDGICASAELLHMACGDTTSQTESDKILNSCIAEVEAPTEAINEYSATSMMQCCFPSLFPDGRGGLHPIEGEERAYEYDLAAYCAHLMAWHDRRFVMHKNFKFFCLNLIQRRQIDGLTRRIPDCKEAIDIRTADQDDPDGKQRAKRVLQELKPFFKTVRGSGLYWSRVRDELMAMLGNKVLPTAFPTFFFTLSAADTVWPDVFRACDSSISLEQARSLPSSERRRLLNENPDIASRHFYRRFKAFFDNIICGESKPLGQVSDFFWRVEFQKRGSPHIHGLLWIQDAPDVLHLSETEEGRDELARFVDQFISTMSYQNHGREECECSVCSQVRGDPCIDILGLRADAATGESTSQCDLARLIRRVQQHACFDGSSCRAKTGTCRFEYPKPLRTSTEVIVEKTDNGALKLKIECMRDDPNTNNYNPELLRTWRANMDIKLIGNAYGAAEYTAAYVSKSEPDTTKFRDVINRALDRCGEDLEHHRVLRRVANAALAAREVSAQEALWILQAGLPMYGKSRNVVSVKSSRHSKRFYRVPPAAVRQLLHDGIDLETPRIRITPVEAAYMARPCEPPFEDMPFSTFCENYDLVDDCESTRQRCSRWERTDGIGAIRARRTAQVIAKTPHWKRDEECPNYCFSELFFSVPWRRLEDLPEEDEDCVAQFKAYRESLSPSIESEMSEATERERQLELLSESRSTSVVPLPSAEWRITDPGESEYDFQSCNSTNTQTLTPRRQYVEADIQRAETFVETVIKPYMKDRQRASNQQNVHGPGNAQLNHKIYQYPIGLQSGNMKDDQWQAFALCMQQSRIRWNSNISSIECAPLRMIINGEGGCGKSWLIHHIVKDIHHVFHEEGTSSRYSKRVLLLAHFGSAAFNIKGTTICSALALPISAGWSFESPYQSMTATKGGPEKLRKLQDTYASIHMVIVDEYSVISCAMIHWMDMRMREIWPKQQNVPFGGRDVIFAGDLGQLSPVMPAALFTPIEDLSSPNQQRGRLLWSSITVVCNLTSQNRGEQDPHWYEALARLRRMEQTAADVALFNTRYVAGAGYAKDGRFIAYKNEDVNRANKTLVSQQAHPVHSIPAQHCVQLCDPNYEEECDNLSHSISSLLQDATIPNKNRDRTVPLEATLAIGAPVALTFNLAQTAGLCNGTKATVFDFMPRGPGQLPIVLVQVQDKYIGPSFLADTPNVVPITPRSITWSARHARLRTKRTGLPLRLAYAMTIHKVQELTCECVTFDPTNIPTSAFAYVALSRVRRREDITLTRRLEIKQTSSQLRLKAKLAAEWGRLDHLHELGKRTHTNLIAHFQAVAESENDDMLSV